MPTNEYREPNLNQITIVGRLTREPELRYLESGMALCKISIANNERYKTKAGEKKEDSLFINVTCWAGTAEFVGTHMKKGYSVLVIGKLRMEQWEDRDTGQKRNAISITAVSVQQLTWDNSRAGGGKQGGGASSEVGEPEIDDNSIPF